MAIQSDDYTPHPQEGEPFSSPSTIYKQETAVSPSHILQPDDNDGEFEDPLTLTSNLDETIETIATDIELVPEIKKEANGEDEFIIPDSFTQVHHLPVAENKKDSKIFEGYKAIMRDR